MNAYASTTSPVPDLDEYDQETFKKFAPEHYSRSLFHELSSGKSRIPKESLQQFVKDATDVFLTHDWGHDELNRDNHARVVKLNRLLKEKGLRTWFDEDRLHGNINEQILKGLVFSSFVVVFITERYMTKVNGNGKDGLLDNCRFEFNDIVKTKPSDRIIPVVMEPRCRDQKRWIGLVGAKLRSQLCIDFCSDEAGRAEAVAADIVRMVRKDEGFKTANERFGSFAPLRTNDQSGSVSQGLRCTWCAVC
jgi:hypothetical protein